MKIANIVKIVGIVIVICSSVSCVREKGEHEFITFINRSNDTIHVVQTKKIKIATSDTVYNCRGGSIELLKGDSCQFFPLNYYWETDLIPGTFVQFFVFPRSIFTYSTCEEAIKDQLKRYQLTEADLDSLNWTITYP